MKNTAPNNDANIRKAAALPAANARERNSCIGSIGSRVRSSRATKPASSATPPASAASASTMPQPAALPRTSPHTSPERGARDQRQAGDVQSRARRGSRSCD